MLKANCCICGKDTNKPYVVIKHYEDHIKFYDGHKGCLRLLEDKLQQGEVKHSVGSKHEQKTEEETII